MTARERFARVCRFDMELDRLPRIEWAAWWDQTLRRWEAEGMPAGMDLDASLDYFALDKMICTSVPILSGDCPREPHFGAGLIADEAGYERLLPYLYREEPLYAYLEEVRRFNARGDREEIVWRYWLDGFFWFPRRLLGIENHLTAFYDQPELMHRINRDQAEYCMRFLERLYEIDTPEFMTFAEDMSYNHGPMLSKEGFDAFLLPYYRQLIPFIRAHGTRVLVDTDGNVEPLIPWLLEAGIEGVLPLERQAGVDVCRIREQYPEFILIGGYDKTIMHLGEEAMRSEFERIMPAMRAGRFVPSVDHQTPPDVTLEQYRIYVRLLKEYAAKAVGR